MLKPYKLFSMETYRIKFQKIISFSNSILQLKRELENEFISTFNKNEFLEYLEYEYLPEYKIEIQRTLNRFPRSGLIQDLSLFPKQKVEYLELWLNDHKITNVLAKEYQLPNNLSNYSETNLFKELFCDTRSYEKVIEIMIENGRMMNNDGKLVFIPITKGCKYEIEALRIALSFKKIMKPGKPSCNELVNIYSKSFGIDMSTRTLGSASIPDKAKKYIDMLADIH